MNVQEALLSRRTTYAFVDRPVPPEAIARALEAARWAPNHKLTEPWRFRVLGPETTAQVAAIAGRLAREKASSASEEDREKQGRRAEEKITGVPALVAVAQVRTPEDPFRDREDFAAVTCAIHNFVLSLWAEGIGCQWSTGAVTRHADTARRLGIEPPTLEIVGLLRIGYPAQLPAARRRPLEEVARFLP